jgi:ribose transport system substrate-binding protein
VKNPTFKLFTVSTQNDHARLAIDWAVALATGGKKPATTHFPALTFENSVTGKPHPVECRANLPGDIYLSAELPAAVQAKLGKKEEWERWVGGGIRSPHTHPVLQDIA